MRIFKSYFRRRRAIFILFALLLATAIVATLTVFAANRAQRPITDNGGIINQTHLWMKVHNGYEHRGVDSRYHGLGTDVHAIADGVVRELIEYESDDEGEYFGNFILIRHDWWHYDRTTDQMAYAYTIYAHLKHNSVVPTEGTQRLKKEFIRQVAPSRPESPRVETLG